MQKGLKNAFWPLHIQLSKHAPQAQARNVFEWGGMHRRGAHKFVCRKCQPIDLRWKMRGKSAHAGHLYLAHAAMGGTLQLCDTTGVLSTTNFAASVSTSGFEASKFPIILVSLNCLRSCIAPHWVFNFRGGCCNSNWPG